MLLLAAGVWIGSESLRNQRQPLAPLESLIDQETKGGWRVARRPELAGPYRRGENPQYVGRGAVASVTTAGSNGPVSFKLPVRDDAEQMIVPLRTAGGAFAVAVLER